MLEPPVRPVSQSVSGLSFWADLRAVSAMPRIFILIANAIANIGLAAPSALAHHDGNTTGGASFTAILPIIVVGVLGMFGLAMWGRKKRKTKSRRTHKRR